METGLGKQLFSFEGSKETSKISGDDAPMGNTRTHAEHDGEDIGGR